MTTAPEPKPAETRMRRIRWWFESGFHGGERTGTIEVSADADGDEIEAEVREEVFQYFEWGWSFAEDSDDDE